MTVLLQRTLVVLMLTTVGLMIWHELGMEYHYAIDPPTDLPVTTHDDRDVRGRSIARLKQEDDAFIMQCELRQGFPWPYCQLAFTLAYPPSGINLARYDTLKLNLDITGPGEPSVRVHLRNYEPGLSSIRDYASLRVNELEYRPSRTGRILEVPLSRFEVAPWWRDEYNLSFEDYPARLDNVARIEILTGTLAPVGEYVLTLNSMTFSGKWIARDQLYFGILGAWLLITLSCLVIWMNITSRTTHAARQRQQELEAVNQALQLRSEEYREQALRDPLTGALNRAGLRDLLHEQVRAVRSGENMLCVILFDIDHFKRVNDIYGHPVGDEILQLFARRIQENTRASDHLVRWGGEEFLLVCSSINLAEATRLAEKLLTTINESAWPHGETLTCSIGVGQLENETIAELLARVDQALYRAKAAGRNRVEAASQELAISS